MLERTKLGFSSDNEGNFSFGVIHKLRSCLRGEGIKADVYKRGGGSKFWKKTAIDNRDLMHLSWNSNSSQFYASTSILSYYIE